MSTAFLRCGACGRVVRRIGQSCPDCRQMFPEPAAGLSAHGRAVLTLLKDGPLAGPTIAERLSRHHHHQVVHPELAQLEARGLVVTRLGEPADQSRPRIYLITELGREIVEESETRLAPAPLPGPGTRSTKMTVTVGAMLVSRARQPAERLFGRSGGARQPQLSL